MAKLKPVKTICFDCKRPSIDGITHVKCKKPQGIDGLISIWEYKGLVKLVVKSLKYRFAKDMSKDLSFLVTKYLKENINALPEEAYLVPIPLHKRRKNWRGFNQSEILGNDISGRMNWKFIPDLLIRKDMKKPQVELVGEERAQNVKGVFTLNQKYSVKNIKLPTIIFDDVYTTGSTIKEACKVLKRNGVKVVWGLTVAG